MFNPIIALIGLVLILAGGDWFENATTVGWVLFLFVCVRAAVQVHND